MIRIKKRLNKIIIKDGIEYMRCSGCGELKPKTKEYYYVNNSKIYGYHIYCKKCAKLYRGKRLHSIEEKILLNIDEADLYEYKRYIAVQQYLKEKGLLRLPHNAEIEFNTNITPEDLAHYKKFYYKDEKFGLN